MTTKTDQLKRLISTSRGTGRLDPAPSREAIPAAFGTGLPTEDDPQASGGGISSPLTEQSRVTSTVRICCDTDPTLFIDFEVSTQITFEDADGNTIVLDLTPDLTSNCP